MKALAASDTAAADIQTILAYYDLQPGLQDRIAADIEAALIYRCEWPSAGHVRKDLTTEQVLFWLVAPHFLVYQIRGETLYLVSALHTSRDLFRLLKARLNDENGH